MRIGLKRFTGLVGASVAFAAALPAAPVAAQTASAPDSATPPSATRPSVAPPEPSKADAPPKTEPSKPWRLYEVLGTEPYFKFGLEHRVRLEHLVNDFRASTPTNASAIAFRTLLSAEGKLGPVVIGAELQDSRQIVTDETPVNTGAINTFELLQGYVGIRAKDVLAKGDSLEVLFGRQTMDLANRRLVARNDFRNTSNGYSGLSLNWLSTDKHQVRSFAFFPVNRMVSEEEELRDNLTEFDQENTHQILWGSYVLLNSVLDSSNVEFYVIGLHESDGAVESANRRLTTPVLRWFRPAAPGQLDFQLEGMAQVGRSRASSKPEDVRDLEHRAFATHASLGYQVALPWAPRFSLGHDYASGDVSPDDDENNRFDTLFGARRFEFGPTGLFGALSRNNVVSPFVRFEAVPIKTIELMTSHRLAWLASSTDAWVPAGQRDDSGRSGTFIGYLAELRARWTPFPKNLSVELGGAVLTPGGFAKVTNPGLSGAPSVYSYLQATAAL